MSASARKVSPDNARPGPARQGSLRFHNLGVLFDALVHTEIPLSRADLAQVTGLTRATVSALVDQLITANLIEVLPTVRSESPGRPAAPLVPKAGALAALGAEINVDYLGVRAVDLSGVVIADRHVSGDYRNSDPSTVVKMLSGLVNDVLTDEAAGLPVPGLCVALPGVVDSGAGRLRLAPNLGWRDVDVVGKLSRLLNRPSMPIQQVNEATLAAQAEAAALRPQGISSFFYVSGAIGVGGALVTGGRVSPGRHGWSGEIGHTVVDPNGPPCSCSATGCLEQYAGTDAMLHAAELPVGSSIAGLALAARASQRAAVAALDRAAWALGLALSSAINLFDVDTIVLGGAFAPISDLLRPTLQRHLRQRVLWNVWAPTAVRAATLTGGAALTGAALQVRAGVVGDPLAWIERQA